MRGADASRGVRTAFRTILEFQRRPMTHVPLILALSTRSFAERQIEAEIARAGDEGRRRWLPGARRRFR